MTGHPVPAPALSPVSTLDHDQRQRGLRLVILDGLASQVMTTLAGGVFLTAYALSLGASNSVIGLLAALPLLAQVFQLPAVALVERLRNRRLVTVLAALGGRIAVLGVAAAVLLPAPWGLGLLVGALALQAVFGAISGCAWNGWMRDLVPRRILGRFFGRRLFAATALGAILSYAAARLIDLGSGTMTEANLYALLALAGALVGFVGVVILARTPEPAMPPPRPGDRLMPLLAEPFRDANFRKLMGFMGVWGFALHLATPFFTVFMLRDLGLDMATVIPLTILSQVANLAVLTVWGRLADRLGNKPVLMVCGALHMVVLVGWTFVTFPETHAATLPLLAVLHVVLGVATAGVTLSAGTIALKLAPAGKGTSYLAMNGMVAALGAGLAPLVGGALADLFAGQTLAFTLTWTGAGSGLAFDTIHLAGWDFFFVLSAAIVLYALRLLRRIDEPGHAGSGALLRALGSARTWGRRHAGKKSSSAAATASGASSTRKWPASSGTGVQASALGDHSAMKS